MRRYIFVLLATTKFLGKSFVFKNNDAKEGLRKDNPSGLGAGGPEFKSRRPDQSKMLRFAGQEVATRNKATLEGVLAHGKRQ